jgi:hypothetical protein
MKMPFDDEAIQAAMFGPHAHEDTVAILQTAWDSMVERGLAFHEEAFSMDGVLYPERWFIFPDKLLDQQSKPLPQINKV